MAKGRNHHQMDASLAGHPLDGGSSSTIQVADLDLDLFSHKAYMLLKHWKDIARKTLQGLAQMVETSAYSLLSEL